MMGRFGQTKERKYVAHSMPCMILTQVECQTQIPENTNDIIERPSKIGCPYRKNKIGFLPAPQESIPDGLKTQMSKVNIKYYWANFFLTL